MQPLIGTVVKNTTKFAAKFKSWLFVIDVIAPFFNAVELNQTFFFF